MILLGIDVNIADAAALSCKWRLLRDRVDIVQIYIGKLKVKLNVMATTIVDETNNQFKVFLELHVPRERDPQYP